MGVNGYKPLATWDIETYWGATSFEDEKVDSCTRRFCPISRNKKDRQRWKNCESERRNEQKKNGTRKAKDGFLVYG